MSVIRVCFVCLGNICRSPTAEGVFRALVADAGLESSFRIDSAGTGSWHVGARPDQRAAATARTRGLELTSRARQFRPQDFDAFDHVVAMDSENLEELRSMARGPDDEAKLHLLRDFDPEGERGLPVPDPYYGGPGGFEDVFDICEAACRGLLTRLATDHGL